jgi:hypothetical protein
MIEATRRLPIPKRLDIAIRIDKAWERISPATIKNTWRHVGIQTANDPVLASLAEISEAEIIPTMATIL